MNGRSPMKQMPVLSGLLNTGSPARCASARTSCLGQRADRKQHLRKLSALDPAQEIGLVFRRIGAAQQSGSIVARFEPRVVAGGEVGGAQAPRVVKADAELDLAIAQYIGVGRAPALVLR